MEQNRQDLILRPPAAPPGPMEPAYPNAPESHGRYPGKLSEEEDQGGLIEYWRILRRRKRTVLAVAFAGLLAGALVTLPQTPVYQANTSLEIQDLNQDFMNMKNVNPVSDSPNSTACLTFKRRSKSCKATPCPTAPKPNF